jgi:hypothetical protein
MWGTWGLGLAFNDKRITCVVVFLWIVVSIGFYENLGAFELEFMTIGPSSHTKFMGAVLDTWPKWAYVACFSLMNTCINEFVNDALVHMRGQKVIGNELYTAYSRDTYIHTCMHIHFKKKSLKSGSLNAHTEFTYTQV